MVRKSSRQLPFIFMNCKLSTSRPTKEGWEDVNNTVLPVICIRGGIVWSQVEVTRAVFAGDSPVVNSGMEGQVKEGN